MPGRPFGQLTATVSWTVPWLKVDPVATGRGGAPFAGGVAAAELELQTVRILMLYRRAVRLELAKCQVTPLRPWMSW